MNRKKKIVGYIHKGYNEQRNSFGQTAEDFIFKKQNLDLFKVFDYAYFKLKNKTNNIYHNFHLGCGNFDLFHFFNGINLGKTPWITSFETSLPRVNNNSFIKLGIKRLEKENCKQLIAMSRCAYTIQQSYLETNFPNVEKTVMEKTIILHPPQKQIIGSYEEKKLDNAITFTLIGADFFRKGGMEVLEVFDDLLSKKKGLKLNIISSMQYGDYATKSTKQDLDKALKIIAKYPKNISHYKSLPNAEVINLLKNSHIGLLPTYADTYGYSAIEAQACGCPVISTDIRALPEINNNKIGYQINVPTDKSGNGILEYTEDRIRFSATLREQLLAVVLAIEQNPYQIKEKGVLCLENIDKNHSITKHAKTLNQIYLDALAS